MNESLDDNTRIKSIPPLSVIVYFILQKKRVQGGHPVGEKQPPVTAHILGFVPVLPKLVTSQRTCSMTCQSLNLLAAPKSPRFERCYLLTCISQINVLCFGQSKTEELKVRLPDQYELTSSHTELIEFWKRKPPPPHFFLFFFRNGHIA